MADISVVEFRARCYVHQGQSSELMSGLEKSTDASTDSPTVLADLTEEERTAALDRFRVIQPHLEHGVFLTSIANTTGTAYRTLTRWVSLYRCGGLVALGRKDRADKGTHRSLSPIIRRAIEGLALQRPKLPIATLYRRIKQLASDQGEEAPSYEVVRGIIRNLPADLVMLAQEGTKAYSETFDLVHRREATCSNAIWQADHTLLDIVVLNDSGNALKPWLTVVEDDYSRAIAGYFLSFEAPSAIRTALALRQAIWRKEDPRWQVCGIPELLYTDNGSDFTSHHLEQVAVDLKIRLVFSIPGHPRGRGRIERMFSTVNQLFLSGLPGYAPPGKGGSRSRPTLTLAALDRLFLEFILSDYHTRSHSEIRNSPIKRWEGDGFLPRMPASLEQLDLLLLTVRKTRRVHPDGIRFQGLRYVDTNLAAFIGETVTLRYDPRDVAEIRIFHDGKFLCRAVCPDLAGETVSLQEILRARGQRRRELQATIRDRRETVEALLNLKRGHHESVAESFKFSSGEEKPPVEVEAPARLKRYHNE